MSAGTPPPPRPPDPSTTLDREDHEGYAEAVRRQWGALGYLLGFGHLRVEDLSAANAPLVIQNIANRMATTRGAIATIPNLQTALTTQYQTELLTAQQAVPPGTVGGVATPAGLPIAKALIEVVNQHFERQDIQSLMAEIPSAIRPITGGRWTGTAVLGALGAQYTIGIDLTDTAWKQGDEAAIRQKLIGRRPSDVGINTDSFPVPGASYDQPLTDADINHILATTCNIVSQRVPLWNVELADTPVAGQRTMVDTAGLLRANPTLAHMDQAALLAYFSVNRPELAHFRTMTIAGAPVGIVVPLSNVIVDALFARLSRTGRPLAEESSNLTDAIRNRGSVDRLLATNANNRELLLALATIRRNPSAADVIPVGGREMENLNRRCRVAEILGDMGAYTTIVPPAPLLPDSTLQDIRTMSIGVATDITTLQGRETAWMTADTAHQAAVQAYQVNFSTYERDKQDRDAIIVANDTADRRYHADLSAWVARGSPGLPPPTPTPTPVPAAPVRPVQPTAPTFTAFTLTTPFAGGPIRSIDELRTKLSDYRRIQNELTQLDARLEERGRTLVALFNALRVMQLDVAALFPAFSTFINPAGPAFHPHMLHVNENWNALVQEIRRNTPEGLQSTDDYTKRIEELRTRGAERIDGSRACWDIIRRGLENQRHPPLTQEEVESILQSCRAQVQLSRELRQDITLFEQRDIPTGSGQQNAAGAWVQDHEARAWDQSRSYRRLWTAGIWGSPSALNEYTENLFQVGRIGMPLNANPRERQYRIPQLVDAYRTVKYLLERAPEPYRLPNSERYQLFLRNVHGAILERAFLSFDRASSMNPAEMGALRGAGVTDTMSADERLQAVRSFLLDHAEEYYKTRGPVIEAMAKTAYRPIQNRIDGHNRWKGFLGGSAGAGGEIIKSIGLQGQAAKWYNPLTYPGRIVQGSAYGVASVLDAGPWSSGVNPLTWPAKTVKLGVREWKAVAGAGVGFAVGGPIGAVIGGVLARKIFGGGKKNVP